MTSVAGDFYDYVVVNEQQAGLLIATYPATVFRLR